MNNRIIKFRFWKDDRMKQWDDFACLDMCDWLNKDNIVSMQFTGLTDITYREIYEGDILQAAGEYMVVLWNNKNARWSVKRSQTKFPVALYHWNFKSEISGNIYENPELLT